MSKNSIRPFLKWLGNKYRLIHHLAPLLPEGKRLVEPFTGSGAVFMNSEYPSYLLAEQNSDLVFLYQSLQKEGLKFIQYCKQFFSEINNSEIKFYELRDKFNAIKDKRRRAAIFLYLNRHGYNGLCRYNQQGKFNVPFGRYDKPYFPQKEMLHFFEKSQKCHFIHGDFLETLNQAKIGDVIYCDPPYAPLTHTANFTSYTDKQFGLKQQKLLAQLAKKLANRGIPVIISNHDTEFTRQCYQDAKIKSFEIQRFISCQGKKRTKVRELIAVFD